MLDPSIQQLYDKLQNFQHKYCGTLDENGLRRGAGCQQWSKGDSTYEYSGQFLHNNLHNKATYIIEKNGDQAYYDGLFYCNKLEGYGKVISNNTIFEGLFKEHLRFGPGVLTNEDDTQDVGIWEGFTLRKLIVSVGEDFVPRLGQTSLGRARLLKFRKLVPVGVKRNDPGKEALTELTTDEEIISESHQLYNPRIRNPESLFFRESSYRYFTEEDCTIDVVISEEEFNGSCESPGSNTEELEERCYCFQENLDTFGHVCVQLNDVEVKLQKLQNQRAQIERQLSICKNCCANMIPVCNQPPESDQRTTSEHVPSLVSLTKPSKSSSLILSEIELQTYSYIVHETASENEEFTGGAGSSRITLPFSNSLASSPSACDDLHEETEHGEELRACICTAMLVENIDILQAKLQTIQQQEVFFGTVKTALQNHLDAQFQRLELQSQATTRFMRKVTITDLLAWNNEELWIEILQHCFRHRSSEHNVSFNVSNLLTSHRHYFKEPGVHETECRKFLEECAHGNERNVFGYLKTGNINPDLCDARGNTGLMLATVSDQIYVIATLVNCGAKLDAINDEGLTPLTMALLRYISNKFGIVDWETAFLKEELQDFTAPQWLPADSLLSVYINLIEKKWDNEEDTEEKEEIFRGGSVDTLHDYFFKTDFPVPRHPKETKETKKKKKKIEDVSKEMTEAESVSRPDLKTIKRTVFTLLNYKCDPNFGIPLKPIFLAIFTDDSELLHGLLKNNADPDATADGMTGLHVIASIKPSPEKVKMCETLLLSRADPNIKTDHWSELNKLLLGEGITTDTNEGKSALHLLSVRQDFTTDSNNLLGTMANLLVLNGCRSDLCLGHTPLSLAVLRGNTRMIESLLKTKRVDPHQLLGNKMGNALTVLVLNRFRSVLPEDKVSIAKTLFDFGLNPLTGIGEFENVVAFVENENAVRNEKKKGSKPVKNNKKKSPNKLSKSSSKKSKSHTSKEKKKLNLDAYILQRSKEILFRHVQSKAVEYSYILISEGFVDPLIDSWAKFITTEEALHLLRLLFQNQIIQLDSEALNNYLDYLRVHHNSELDENEAKKLHDLVNILEEVYPCQPEIDRDDSKYRICFHCLKSQEFFLLKCPSCELLYFCSRKCNNESKKDHPCNNVFYPEKNARISQTNRLETLLELANRMKQERSTNASKIDKKQIKSPMNRHTKNAASPILTPILSHATILSTPVPLNNDCVDNPSTTLIQPSFKKYLDSLPKKAKFRRSSRVSKELEDGSPLLQEKTANATQKQTIATTTVPDKHYYMELLSKIFADFNLPLLLLPYACYKDGQVYYKLSESKTNNVPEFYQLTIPK